VYVQISNGIARTGDFHDFAKAHSCCSPFKMWCQFIGEL